MVCNAQVPKEAAESERLLAETRALDVLEAELAADLDFGNLSTAQVEPPPWLSHLRPSCCRMHHCYGWLQMCSSSRQPVVCSEAVWRLRNCR